jgi:hypothetical protein
MILKSGRRFSEKIMLKRNPKKPLDSVRGSRKL